MHELTWYRADLLPNGLGIFADDFYPEPKRGTNAMRVWFTQLKDDAQGRVLICPRLNGNWVRAITLELACSILEAKENKAKATQEETDILNEKAKNVMNRLMKNYD